MLKYCVYKQAFPKEFSETDRKKRNGIGHINISHKNISHMIGDRFKVAHVNYLGHVLEKGMN